MRKVLAVTGITGHSGRYFLRELINAKYPDTLRCLIRESSDTKEIDGSGLDIEKVIGELPNTKVINHLVNGADTVLHIANIHYSLPIVKAAVDAHVRRIILVHTTGIYSKYKMASAEYKAIEDELSKFVGDVSITILRPTMIFGDLCDHNISKFIRMVDTMPITFEINHGESKLQPVNARDLGRAYYQVIFQLQLPQLYYDVTGERSVTIHELLLLIGSYLGKKVNLISIPLNVGTMGAKLIKIITFGRVNYVERVLRMGEDRDYTHVAAADDFGYYAEPFEKGLKREVDEYLSSINKGIERG